MRKDCLWVKQTEHCYNNKNKSNINTMTRLRVQFQLSGCGGCCNPLRMRYCLSWWELKWLNCKRDTFERKKVKGENKGKNNETNKDDKDENPPMLGCEARELYSRFLLDVKMINMCYFGWHWKQTNNVIPLYLH